MPGNTGWLFCTGESSAVLSGGTLVQVDGVWTDVTGISGSHVRFLGTTDPQGLQFAGIVYLTSVQGGAIQPEPFVNWWHHLRFTQEQPFPSIRNVGGPTQFVNADTVRWRLPPGLQLRVWVDWL